MVNLVVSGTTTWGTNLLANYFYVVVKRIQVLSQAAAVAQFQKRHEGGDSKISGARAVSEEFKGGICRNLQKKTCLMEA